MFIDFTKFLFALSSLVQPVDQVRSIQEHFFIMLSQLQAYAGRFQEETGKKNRSKSKMATLEPSVHPIRNCLCYHFTVYRPNK